MAYRGYLVKVGDYIIPNSIIQANSYKPSLKGQDLDSYRDLDGKLHREALANFAPKVEFNTRPMLTNNEVINHTSFIEHEATVSKINEDQLFYLMSKGMSKKDATQLIIMGFIAPFSRELPMEYAVELNQLIKLEMTGAIG